MAGRRCVLSKFGAVCIAVKINRISAPEKLSGENWFDL